MQALAQGLASLGRNGDSMLVHMTPKEVQGLQQLALAKGGSLTTNPHTGLPEAGFLQDILPGAAALAANFFMPGIGALGTGLVSGITSYLTTKDPGRALTSGLLSGGLSSLMGGISDVGEKSILDAASNAANQTGDLAARNVMGTDLMGSNLGPTPSEFARPEDFMQNPYSAEGIRYQVAQGTPLEQVAQSAKDAATNATSMPALDMGSKFSAGLDKVTSSGKNAMDFLSANKLPLAAAGLGLAGMMAPQPTAPASLQPKTGYTPQYGFQQAQYDASGRLIAPASYASLTPRPYTYYAANGGSVPNTFPQSNIEQMAYSKSLANPTPTNVVGIPSSDYDARINQQGDVFTAAGGGRVERKRYVEEDTGVGPYSMSDDELDAMKYILKTSPGPKLASGGIASLGGEYAAGGKLLQGPGDGMSDSIPAVIKGAKPQRAALAQGEFVVPADVVSHLGNGSTDAGAKRLYAMMDKVRQARTGTKKQGRQINPERFMPA